MAPAPHLPQSTLSGTAAEGQALTCANNVLSIPVIGGLINSLPKTWRFQRNGGQVQAGSSPNYGLGEADVGGMITCSLQITGSIDLPGPLPTVSIGTISSTLSAPQGPVTALPLTLGANPTISGTAQAGQTLSCAAGSWSPAPHSSTLEWLRNGGVVGSGATYALTGADVGQSVACRENVSRLGQSNSATSNSVSPTAAPVNNPPANNPPANNPPANTPPVNTPPVDTPPRTGLTNAQKRKAAIRKCKKKFRGAAKAKKRAACIKKARRKFA